MNDTEKSAAWRYMSLAQRASELRHLAREQKHVYGTHHEDKVAMCELIALLADVVEDLARDVESVARAGGNP